MTSSQPDMNDKTDDPKNDNDQSVITDFERPSDFAALGFPNLSCFNKSELERLALEYVRALSVSGDCWDVRLSPKEVIDSLNGDCGSYLRVLARRQGNPRRWDVVTRKLTSADGAKEVWKFSMMRHKQ